MNEIKEAAKSWKNDESKTVTFIVTKDCQLICKYCYLVGKNSKERMSFETAQRTIDYLLDNPQYTSENAVVFEFIGGEPFLEIELIDKICDYIKTQLYLKNHHWFDAYRFSFSTNGINYHTNPVQNFIKKNHSHLSIGITIDGTKIKHDLNRIYKNGRGSYEDVLKNIPLWLKQFPGAGTKVTISSPDIPYICESVLHLYSLGIEEVNINCVYEDVWKEGDDLLFEEQLIKLADEIIENDLYKKYTCSFFSMKIGKPVSVLLDNHNFCGAGKMLSIDAAGNFYPCTRFAQYSLRDKKALTIGNIKQGIDRNRLRPFLTLDRFTQCPKECLECEIAGGCGWCSGENYDSALTDTIYQRSTANCLMHKARVRANNYYWNKLYRKLEMEGKSEDYINVSNTPTNNIC